MADVFVNRSAVGTLSREELLNRFAYDSGVPTSQAVSLLMPVDGGSYVAERTGALHPVFDMNLPEGALREAVANLFAKALPIFDDLALFQIVGRSLIGRIRFAPSVAELDQVPSYNLTDLLKSRGTGDLFAELLTRYAQYSGVAGVQPKVLVRDNGSLRTTNFRPVGTGERLTARGTTHIVKSPDGTYLAFEDGCALAGRLSREKYEGSYEQLAGTLAAVIRSPDGTVAELGRFFRSLVLTMAVRNGDAHRKNFGVIYDDATGDVTLAPTFDVITTTAYIRQDTMALTMDGTKRWPDRRRLERFGVRHCQLTPAAAKLMIAEVAEAVTAVSGDLADVAELDREAGETGALMKSAWAEGVASLARAES